MRAAWPIGLGAVLLGACAPPAHAQQWTLSSGVHLDAYEDDGDPKLRGRQIFAPFVLAVETERWSIRASGGYADSSLEFDVLDAELRHLVDTTLGITYTPDLFGGLAALGIAVDFPTGKRKLTDEQQLAEQDRDLVLIWDYGAGGNLNLHADWARSFGRITVGVGGGFLYRRKYDPTVDIPDDDLDPGNQWTASGQGEVALTEALAIGVQVTHLRFGVDERGGQDFFQVGPVFEVQLSLDYRPGPWWVGVVPKATFIGRSKRVNEEGRLAREEESGSGALYLVSIEGGYLFQNAFALRGMASLLYVDANGYPADHPFFDAGRTKIAFGPGITWIWREQLTVDFSVKYFWLWDQADALSFRDTRYTGVHVDLLLTYRF